ncbi:hypothetical protein ACFWPX_21375 [Nocardia sp. NPDC058518]|uniref:hypothetical protein n=1 Tax=Nocardia sp. NPDC058518 TaxID=3346534 RepID=UPI00364E4C69
MRTMSRYTAAAAAVAVLIAPLTACGSSDDPAPQQVTSKANSRPEDPKPGIGQPFIADPTLVNPNPIPFTSWNRLSENKISVNFQTGNPECYAVDATVTETAEAVTVALRSGTRADSVNKMCTMNAVFGTLEIPLSSPLGTREVLDAG